jgi:hypothetical protein
MNDEQGLTRVTMQVGIGLMGWGARISKAKCGLGMWKPAKKKIFGIVRTGVGRVRRSDTG